ncbi:uncharacterized protein LOC114354965 [Ostrinia furnacalis]|uniref:uncharacterized protein LOC114354965 n=1 Tax=Ostrinia furnacalis TaxID=93504 RepID=UPI001040C3B2|nr:uncharacterized protein LOC114354965 [Ostrinia furnacalis]
MLVDGYKYCKEMGNNEETRWVCSASKTYNCPATITASNCVLKLNKKHNHPRDNEDTVASVTEPETTPPIKKIISVQGEAYFVPSRQGRQVLIVNGHRFHKHKDEADGRVLWRCGKRNSGCTACAITMANVVIRVDEWKHNHGLVCDARRKILP